MFLIVLYGGNHTFWEKATAGIPNMREVIFIRQRMVAVTTAIVSKVCGPG